MMALNAEMKACPLCAEHTTRNGEEATPEAAGMDEVMARLKATPARPNGNMEHLDLHCTHRSTKKTGATLGCVLVRRCMIGLPTTTAKGGRWQPIPERAPTKPNATAAGTQDGDGAEHDETMREDHHSLSGQHHLLLTSRRI
jgi:hypothetical protein